MIEKYGAFEMDHTLRSALAVGLISATTLMSVIPHGECERGDFCEIKSRDLHHANERVPAPVQTSVEVTAVTTGSTGSTGGTMFTVMK
ncbi:MAG: hypothetical protein P8Y71_14165 [Pseudolabrys sp.]|jgi:hypothetical protein